MKHVSWCVALLLTCNVAGAADFDRYAFTLELLEGKTANSVGTGFLVGHGGATYYVTAHHVFKNSEDRELASAMKSMTFVNQSDSKVRVKPESFVRVVGVQDSKKNDFLIFKVKAMLQHAKYTLKVSADAPALDETVYLVATLPGRRLTTYPVKVQRSKDELAQYEKLPDVTEYTGASGAPILNGKGELVGTYLGRRTGENGSTRALIGTPLAALKEVLDASGGTKGGGVARP